MTGSACGRLLRPAGLLAALALLVAFGLSCGESSPTGSDSDDFSFRVTVVDARGRSVEGLLIGVWNDFYVNRMEGDTDSRFLTRMNFEVAEEADVTLEAYELDGQFIETLRDEQCPAGAYTQSFSGSVSECPFGTRITEMLMVARDTDSRAILFRDSIYAVYWNAYNKEQCVIGATSASGVFETDDRLLFPNLFDLGWIPRTGPSSPVPVGNLKLSDNVYIAIGDTTGGQDLWMTVHRTVGDGRNSFMITWDPARATSEFPLPAETGEEEALLPARGDRDDVRLYEWKLTQNYPNPYN